MKIAQIATVSTPVRPDHAGSIELLVWLLSRELTRMGHDVTVFGCADSQVDCRFVQTLPGSYGDNGSPDDWNLCEWINLSQAMAHAKDFDIVHSHVYMWGVPMSAICSRMLHTLHILPYDDDANTWRLTPWANVSSISKFQWSEFPDRQPIAVIPHGVDPDQFTFRQTPDDYLCYLGRFIENKGPLQAVLTAKELGMRLVLAGPESDYFNETIRPHVDGRRIEWIGPVSAQQRDRLLGGAKAMLYPLREPEPFGLVQVEAMMCGTPVVAMNIGAVPEIVDCGVSGELTTTVAGLCEATQKAIALNRRGIRETAERRFSVRQMASAYESLYRNIASAL